MIRPVDSEHDPLSALARAAGEQPVAPTRADEDPVATAILAARSRKRRRQEQRTWAMAAIALLAAGAGTWALTRSPEPEAPVAESTPATAPEVIVSPSESVTVLPSGDRLTRLGEGELELAALGDQREVRLARGEMLFEVAPLGEGQSFEVVTPHLRARVIGTVFAVRVDERGSAVEVFEGEVELLRAGSAPVRLRAGERWAPGDGEWTSALAERGRAAAEERARRPRAASMEAEPEATEPATATATNARAEPTLTEVRTWLAEGETERARGAAEAQVRRHPRSGDWRMLLGDAQRLTRDGDAADTYDVAATLLTESQATQAGYLAAELRLGRGDANGALRSLQQARATERGSPVAERASALALRALVATGDRERFTRAANEYRLRFPSGSARPWIERQLERSSPETDAPE